MRFYSVVTDGQTGKGHPSYWYAHSPSILETYSFSLFELSRPVIFCRLFLGRFWDELTLVLMADPEKSRGNE